tara:strand:+ start:209 stop:862 length:654 start_codon:yes stop_codon:yes gene_type:complete
MNLPKLDKFLLVILGVDFIFILLSLIDSFSGLNFNNFAVQNDNLFAEKFQYLKFIGIAYISSLLAIRRRSSNFLVFMIIPIYLYLDDSKQLHERFGNKIASFLYEGSSNDILIRYFRYQDIGEIVYMLLMGLILLIIFLICFKLSDLYDIIFLKKILRLFIIFGIFAIFVDAIHMLSKGFVFDLLTLIEDGGEMIPISLMIGYFFKYLINNRKKYIQ